MDEKTLTPLEARREEVAMYEANIAMYEAIAANLPSEFPAHLEKYKGSKQQHKDIAEVQDMADVELLSDLWAYEGAMAAIRAEFVEKRKSEAILAVLEAQANA